MRYSRPAASGSGGRTDTHGVEVLDTPQAKELAPTRGNCAIKHQRFTTVAIPPRPFTKLNVHLLSDVAVRLSIDLISRKEEFSNFYATFCSYSYCYSLLPIVHFQSEFARDLYQNFYYTFLQSFSGITFVKK